MTCELCERDLRDTAAHLCEGCAADTGERLAALPVLFRRLGEMLVPGRSGDGRGSRPTEAPAPADLDVIEVRAGFDILVRWQCHLAEARGLPRPQRSDDPGRRIAAAAAALRAELPWIAANPAAGQFAAEMQGLHDDTRTVVGQPDLDVRMGRCPTVHRGVACGAELRLPAGQQVLRCAWCGATYPPGVWAALRLAQTKVAAA